jgi:hypothetical protein
VGRQNGDIARRRASWDLASGLVCLLLLLGCSSNDESSKPAKEQCQDFESSYCSKVVECAQSTDRGDFKELCDFSWQVYLPCDNVDSAVSVQPCLDAIDEIQCGAVEPGSFPPYPGLCTGIFNSQ